MQNKNKILIISSLNVLNNILKSQKNDHIINIMIDNNIIELLTNALE